MESECIEKRQKQNKKSYEAGLQFAFRNYNLKKTYDMKLIKSQNVSTWRE